MMSLRIGVFDSGIGGLSVAKELVHVVPAEYVYIGDSLRAPYGNKSKEELLAYTRELLVFLQTKKIDIFVSACNSLSSLDVEPILSELGIDKKNYFDMTMFAECSKDAFVAGEPLLVFATERTVASGVYQELFATFSPSVLASSSLALAIEREDEIVIDEEVDRLIDFVMENKITQVFLGCTHYPLIGDYLDKRFLGTGVRFVDPALYIPEDLKKLGGETSTFQVYTTKVEDSLIKHLESFDNCKVEEVKL